MFVSTGFCLDLAGCCFLLSGFALENMHFLGLYPAGAVYTLWVRWVATSLNDRAWVGTGTVSHIFARRHLSSQTCGVITWK